jgi:hypothetical protein
MNGRARAASQPRPAKSFRIARGGDQLVRARTMLAAREFGHRVPLLGGRQQANLSVGGDSLAVLDDLDTPQLLIPEHVVKQVLIGEHAQAL